MNHNEATNLEAGVKYVLGELSQNQREEYEEHYFDCAECAVDVKVLATFADTTREVLRQERQAQFADSLVPARKGWLRWLRPVAAASAFAALLLTIGYQNLVTIPQVKKSSVSNVSAENPGAVSVLPSAALVFAQPFSLHAGNVRGGAASTERGDAEAPAGDKVQIHPNESFVLKFDFTPSKLSDNYIGQLVNATGHAIFRVSVPGSNRNQKAQLAVPAGLVKPGNYSLIFITDPGAKSQANGEEVLRFGFSVEFLS